jgi:tetratricopeptide (TPR) repeat protein
MKPAQITIPSGIQSFVIVNRSRPAKEERVKNIIEGALTGEAPFVDRHGAEACVKGLADGLSNSPRFKAYLPGGYDLRGTGTREFPQPLDWNLVTDICTKNNVDAIISLETFDSNNHFDMHERQAERKEKNQVIKYTEYTAGLDVQIDAGWRIYYPLQKQLVDQNVFIDNKRWTNSNDSKKRAEQGLPSQERSVSDAGSFAGNQYAIRVSPRWIWVSREYYKKGNTDFETATRKIQTNDWKGAAEYWQKQTQNPDPKIAGMANFNMALACEMEGNLDAALEWLKKAYTDYNNKKARYYMATIQQRIDDQYRLDEQMKGVQ